MKPKSLWLIAALCCWIFTSCDNAGNNNNNNNNNNDSTLNNTTTLDTGSAMNNGGDMMNNNNSDGTVGHDAAEFMREAASGGMMEVALGKLALQNSTSADVKAMGQMLIDDHSAANEKLMAIAKQKGVTMPDSMMDKHHDKYDKLKDEKGKDFDAKFSDISVDDHEDDIDKFTDKAKTITDTDLLTWIKNTLPVLQKHLDHAKMLDKKYNK
jgi:putative membrane protein